VDTLDDPRLTTETEPPTPASRVKLFGKVPWSFLPWAGLTLVAAAASMLRPAQGNQRFTMASEDGAIFTMQVRADGVLRSLVTEYAGYQNLIQRVVAAVASTMPLEWTPAIFYSVAAIIDGAAAVIAGRCAKNVGFSTFGASIIGATVLVLPAAGWEVPDLLTNVGWYVLATFVVFVGTYIVGYSPPLRWAIPLLVVAGLTAPLIAVALPPLAIVTYRRRRRVDVAILTTCACTTAIQLTTSLLSRGVPGGGQWAMLEIARQYAVRVVIGTAVGARIVPSAWSALGTAGSLCLAAIALVLIAYACLRGRSPASSPQNAAVLAYALYSSIAYIAAAIVVRPSFFFKELPIGLVVIDRQVQLWDGRYMAAPATALVFAAVFVGEQLAAKSRSWRRGALLVAAAYVAILIVNFPVDIHHDTLAHWTSQVRAQHSLCVASGGRHLVVIRYGITTNDPEWVVVLTCGQAFGPP
jgi:hypothetical protein